MSALAHGFADGVDGPVEVQRWCPTCSTYVLADDRTERCLWCETETIPAAEARPTERTPLMAIAVETKTCKIDGCEEEPAVAVGIYAGLCETHRDEERASRPPRATGGGNANGYVDRVRALVPLARELDKTTRRLAASTSTEDLKERLGEAARKAQVSPSTENLEQLEKAAKTLRQASARSAPATAAHGEAERKFKLALGAIAADFRTQDR